MSLYIKEIPNPYNLHNINKDKKPKCSLCELDIEVENKTTIPVFLEGEMSYMMLCEKDFNKFKKRVKYKWFYRLIDKIKLLFRKVK